MGSSRASRSESVGGARRSAKPCYSGAIRDLAILAQTAALFSGVVIYEFGGKWTTRRKVSKEIAWGVGLQAAMGSDP